MYNPSLLSFFAEKAIEPNNPITESKFQCRFDVLQEPDDQNVASALCHSGVM